MQKIIIVILAVAVASMGAVAQSQSAPTLRIVTENPNLPSELYYGTIRVKPLRLRPGTNQRITIDDADFFVQQQYVDFLSRFPEPEGFNAWVGVMNRCDRSDKECGLVAVSKSFFQSEEFQIKGYWVYRFYKASLGRIPRYAEFTPDMASVTGKTPEEREAKKTEFANAWAQRAEFKAKYDTLANAAFVDELLRTAEVQMASRDSLVSDLEAGRKTRADVARTVAESNEVARKEYNGAFVAMQYFGYLRRDPEPDGYNAWLKVIDRNPNDAWTMVWGFVTSVEYRNRF